MIVLLILSVYAPQTGLAGSIEPVTHNTHMTLKIDLWGKFPDSPDTDGDFLSHTHTHTHTHRKRDN